MSASASIPSTGFDQLELHPDLERGIRAAGFEDPRPIQLETIPAALEGRDVLGLAQTGTGGILDRLSPLKARKILIHINNTNPILDETSSERKRLTEAGIEVAYDGMEIDL